MDDPFVAFESDFGAVRTPLYDNYRSSPELVRIQHVLAQAIDRKPVHPSSKAEATITRQSCIILDFPTSDIEAARVAAIIASEMKARRFGSTRLRPPRPSAR